MLWTTSQQVATFLRRMADARDAEAKRIGNLIAQVRESRGWSQQDLANEIGISVSTVSRWERGLHRGEPPNVRKLAKALKVAPSLLRPVAPDMESQLDRIETALADLAARLDAIEGLLSPAVAPPEAQVDQLVEEIQGEQGQAGGGDQPGAEHRRSAAAARARSRKRGGGPPAR